MNCKFVATSSEMQSLDKLVMKDFGLHPEVLMERAGLACAETIRECLPSRAFKKGLVLAGPGNNGGDGFVCARHLLEMGYEITVLMTTERSKYKGEAKRNLQLIQKLGVPIVKSTSLAKFKGLLSKLNPHFVVDALFGTGLKRPLTGSLAEIVEELNNLKKLSSLKIFSVDLPSGVSADTGEILGSAIKADFTVTFECLKPGLINYPGKEYAGQVKVVPIGYPWKYLEAQNYLPRFLYLTKEYVAQIFKPRRGYFYKGKAGHLVIFAGSKGKSGAGFLAALGAIKSGVGLVTLAAPASLQPIYAGMLPEALTLPLPETSGELSSEARRFLSSVLANKRAIVIGPGFGLSEGAEELLKALLATIELPTVMDADALTLLAKDLSILSVQNTPKILTPHPGEAARILKRDIKEILQDRLHSALELANLTRSTVVLKGPHTIISTPEGKAYFSPFDIPGLAQGGMGDVLAGIIGSFLAQGYSVLESAILGVYLHGLTGQILSENYANLGFTATDLANNLISAIKLLETL